MGATCGNLPVAPTSTAGDGGDGDDDAVADADVRADDEPGEGCEKKDWC